MDIMKRIQAVAKAEKAPIDFVMQTYATECILRRLASSPRHQDLFLRGGKLWLLEPEKVMRPTNDTDLVGLDVPMAPNAQVADELREILATEHPDGFLAVDVKVSSSSDPAPEGGLRATVSAKIGAYPVSTVIDLARVTPERVYDDARRKMPFPTLFDDGVFFTINAHRLEHSAAEKLATMATHGNAHMRLKDLFDIAYMIRMSKLDGTVVCLALDRIIEGSNLDRDQLAASLEEMLAPGSEYVQRNAREFTTRVKQWLGPRAKGSDLAMDMFAATVRDFVQEHGLMQKPTAAPKP